MRAPPLDDIAYLERRVAQCAAAADNAATDAARDAHRTMAAAYAAELDTRRTNGGGQLRWIEPC